MADPIKDAEAAGGLVRVVVAAAFEKCGTHRAAGFGGERYYSAGARGSIGISNSKRFAPDPK